jgi:hypothetical protein
MDYSARLKRIAAQIKAILEKENVAGLVVLHTPGYSEYLLHLTTSYSCVKVIGNGEVRVQSRLLEDYKGNVAMKRKKEKDTANMLNLIGTTAANLSLSVLDFSEAVDKATGAEHDKGDHRPDNYQDN